MRKYLLALMVVLAVLAASGCDKLKGDKGDTGAAGPTGPAGLSGRTMYKYEGVFNGSGDAIISLPIDIITNDIIDTYICISADSSYMPLGYPSGSSTVRFAAINYDANEIGFFNIVIGDKYLILIYK